VVIILATTWLEPDITGPPVVIILATTGLEPDTTGGANPLIPSSYHMRSNIDILDGGSALFSYYNLMNVSLFIIMYRYAPWYIKFLKYFHITLLAIYNLDLIH
jgi:hypothetical protein